MQLEREGIKVIIKIYVVSTCSYLFLLFIDIGVVIVCYLLLLNWLCV